MLENVRYGLVVSGMPKPQADERARAALDDRRPRPASTRGCRRELSGGQQQRVAVARALVLEPSVLLFDEPLSNLDARLRRQMREEIRELQQRLDLTVVYVTHDQAEAMAVSDRIIVMNKAVIAQEGAPRELYEQPRDAFVAGFMGDANRVRGTLDPARRHASATCARRRSRWRCRIAASPTAASTSRSVPKRSTCAPRRTAPIRGTVRKAAYLGGLMEYTLDTAIGDLFVVSTAVDRPLPVGTVVGVALADHGVVVIPPGAPANDADGSGSSPPRPRPLSRPHRMSIEGLAARAASPASSHARPARSASATSPASSSSPPKPRAKRRTG